MGIQIKEWEQENIKGEGNRDIKEWEKEKNKWRGKQGYR